MKYFAAYKQTEIGHVKIFSLMTHDEAFWLALVEEIACRYPGLRWITTLDPVPDFCFFLVTTRAS